LKQLHSFERVSVTLLQVTSVRLPSDGGRAKGFGYAEFEDRQSLLDALTYNEAVSSSALLYLFTY